MSRGEYVVDGAYVYCKYGSIPQQLSMPADHGCFSMGKPQMHKLDCVVSKNIPSFGICSVTGLPCVPQPANEWVNPHPSSYIDGKQALMTTSLLLCFSGPPGIIKFLSSGQAAMVDASKYGRIETVDENSTIKVVIEGEQRFHSQNRKFKPGEYFIIDGVYYIDERKLEALKSEVKRKDKQLKNNAMIGVGLSNIVGGAYRVSAKIFKAGKIVIKGTKSASTVADSAAATVAVKYGEHIERIKNKKVLRPNVKYTDANGYTYTTDSYGRITNVQGDLVLKKGDLNRYSQRTVGEEDRLLTDQGGHLIGRQFGGSGDIDNLVPQSSKTNLSGGEWYKMEQQWARALKEGEKVTVDIKPIYSGNSKRPDSFKVEYFIEGSNYERLIPNI